MPVQSYVSQRAFVGSAPRQPHRLRQKQLAQPGLCRGLKENVAALPSAGGVRRVLISGHPAIENVEGKKASVAIFSHLAAEFGGQLDKAAAQRGLQLYAEVVDEAREQPGKHPNIDLLLRVVAEGQALRLVVEQGGSEGGETVMYRFRG